MNVTIKNPATGKRVTDLDIVTKDAVIEVGISGRRKLEQLKTIQSLTSKQVIGYFPDITAARYEALTNAGLRVARSEAELLRLLGKVRR